MMQAVIDFFVSGEYKEWVIAVTGVVTAATAITALTPTKTDNKIINTILAILNILAGNILKNKNYDADKGN